jgi:nucleotide-binding universal stress UspA family protein/quercetin dioxygenase-like cupin family protein
MSDIRTILHATDFSDNSRSAFDTACTLARDNNATLLVLHVMAPSAAPLVEIPPPDPLRAAESQGSLGPLPWPQASDRRVRVDHRLAEGDPAEEILRLAAALPCDLIVIGSHGRTGIRRLLTGSVAEDVLRKARCPVLIVKAPLEATAQETAEPTPHAGQPIDVRPLGAALASAVTETLVRTRTLEVVRLIVPAGQKIPQQTSPGEIIVSCLEGRVVLTALGKSQELVAGNLVLLPAAAPHAFQGIESASLLLTVVAPKN